MAPLARIIVETPCSAKMTPAAHRTGQQGELAGAPSPLGLASPRHPSVFHAQPTSKASCSFPCSSRLPHRFDQRRRDLARTRIPFRATRFLLELRAHEQIRRQILGIVHYGGDDEPGTVPVRQRERVEEFLDR